MAVRWIAPTEAIFLNARTARVHCALKAKMATERLTLR